MILSSAEEFMKMHFCYFSILSITEKLRIKILTQNYFMQSPWFSFQSNDMDNQVNTSGPVFGIYQKHPSLFAANLIRPRSPDCESCCAYFSNKRLTPDFQLSRRTSEPEVEGFDFLQAAAKRSGPAMNVF